ncbi:MAG: hypothetical protein HY674_10570 [Chloroflexi bacterium]|nr:hypothetical protein [Chloroflexota bacterium]
MQNTPTNYPVLQARRQALLQQLAPLDQLRRGSLIEQFVLTKRRDGSIHKRGPYPLLTRKQGQKTVSLRLTDSDVVSLYRQQIQAMRQFEKVVRELVHLGEELSDLAVTEQVQKKTRSGIGTSR